MRPSRPSSSRGPAAAPPPRRRPRPPAPTAAPSAGGIVVPDSIKQAGKVVFCVDISFPPEEFYAEDGVTPQGSDIDIANEIATAFGVKAQIDNTGFDGIIPALKAGKCDLIISGMTVTEERSKEVDFVPYLSVGQGIMVVGGNPKGIKSLDDLSGGAVAVQLATTNEALVKDASDKLVAAGKKPIDIQTFDKDTDAFAQLALGRVDGYVTDSVVAAYYLSIPENKDKVEIVATVNAEPIGIPVRKGEAELNAAVAAVIDQLYASGKMKEIVARWGMTDSVELLK